MSADWIAQLMKAGREEFTIPPPSEDPRANGAGTSYDVYGYQLLGPLLGEGEHSSHFLNHVGTDMLWFEQEYAEDNNGRLPWDDVIRPEPRGPQSHAGVPTPRWTRLDYTEGWDDDDPSGMDPMGGLMEGIGSNPEAAREFFTNETVYAPGEEPQLPRVDYLLHDRDWPTSFTWQGGQDTTTYPNAMNHLGDAFEAATTGEGADERSVDIVEEIVSSTYGQMPSGEDAPRFSEEDILDPRVRESLSNVVGHYMPSVHTGLDATNPNPGVDTSDGSVFNDARFNTNGDERATLLMLAELSKDDAGREILTGYNNAQTFEELLHEMDGIDDPSQITLDTESLIGTQVHGAIDFGANSHAAEEALAADENYNQNVDEAVSVSAGLLKDTKFGSAPGVGTLVDLVSAEIAEANHQDSRGELNSELGAIFADNKDVRATLVRDAIWRSIPPDQLPEGMDGTEDLNNLSGADQAAYDSWLEDNDWGDRMSDVSNRAKTDYGPAVRDAEATLEAYGR
ncbi:MAG: hypothetical protein L0H93_16815 [Nocardioides sp.]|nr:hypothetical protein [Nocardioides sp.]